MDGMAAVTASGVPARLAAVAAAFGAAEHFGGVVLVADVAFCRVDGNGFELGVELAPHF